MSADVGDPSRPATELLTGGRLRERARLLAPRDARFVSRSYREPFALVAWHRRPVGVDLERIDPTDDQEFARSIATPEELHEFGRELGDPRLVASLWSGKEALAKLLGDAFAYDPRRLQSPLLWPGGIAGSLRAQQLAAPLGHVAWICWRS